MKQKNQAKNAGGLGEVQLVDEMSEFSIGQNEEDSTPIYFKALSTDFTGMKEDMQTVSKAVSQVQTRLSTRMEEQGKEHTEQLGKLSVMIEEINRRQVELAETVRRKVDTMELQWKSISDEKTRLYSQLDEAISKTRQLQSQMDSQVKMADDARLKSEGLRISGEGGREPSKPIDEFDSKMTYSTPLQSHIYRTSSDSLFGESMGPVSVGGVSPIKRVSFPQSPTPRSGTGKAVVAVPAGSQAMGILTYGAHAPIDGNMTPMVFDLLGSFRGPNNSIIPLKGIKIIAQARGMMTQFKTIDKDGNNQKQAVAKIELLYISGVTEGGISFHKECKGYVIGPDGDFGMKGRLEDMPPDWFMQYTSMGALTAGASALAESTTETSTDINGRQYTNVISGKEAKNALLSGFAGAVNQAAGVMNQRLEAWQKIVVVHPMQKVMLILLEPVVIDEIDVENYAAKTGLDYESIYK
ncbi:MAG: hypothetical protein HQL31_02480 [Planctomycetes bacterium]|nr:hypothetical protein [Planctomycetota bacterium]